MKSKEMQAEKTFIRLTEIKIKLREMVKKKKKKKHEVVNSAKPNSVKDHRRKQKCVITELFPLSI